MTYPIHVAGVIDEQEARTLIECGVTHIGFPLRLAVHKEDLSEEEARVIIRNLKSAAHWFLITYLTKAEEIKLLCNFLGLSSVQLHAHTPVSEIAKLRELAPDMTIIKSLVVRPDNFDDLVAAVKTYAPLVDSFITDTFDPQTGAEGGTGKVHDWSVSRHLVEISPRPVILAGGLNPRNVKQAILVVKPAGVDVHTGIEGANGRKDPELTLRFIEQARQGFQELGK